MGMTMTQKILARAAGVDSCRAGELLMCKLNLVLGNDITAPVAINEFNRMGATKVFDPAKIALIPDHFVPNKDIKAATLAKGADLMYHEATYAAAEQKTAKERGHSTSADAAKAALKAGAKRLIIGHYSSRYKNENILVEEARAIFPETYPATEGVTFTIEKQR